jgi:putative ABC transport system permease protein
MIASLRQALRSLRRSPAFTLTVIATLGIGIGLNAAIFTVVDCVLLRPLGYHDADRIVSLQSHFIDKNRSIPRLGGDDYTDLSQQVKGLEATAYYQYFSDGIRLNGESFYLPVAHVSPRFGQVIGVQPVAGRIFSPSDTVGHDVLVSASFAREHFGSTQAALSQIIQYGGELRPIIGVLPDGFSFPDKTSVWFEANARPETPSRTSYSQMVIGKRRSGVSTQQLSAELATFSRHLQQAFPEDGHKTIEAVPLQEQIVGKIRPTLNLLMGSVAVILLIVCANVTHLQLVRATQQVRSVTIRTALGAFRSTLTSRALLEALLLAVAGCLVAVLLAIPALQLLVRIAPPDIPRLADVHLNLDVLLFSFVLSTILVALTAVLPIWRSWHIDPASALRQDASRGTEGRGTGRLRNGFLIAEVSLTLTLSVAAVMLTRQLSQQSKQDLGFSPENLITLDSHAISTTPPQTPEQVAAATPAQVQAYAANQAKADLAHLHATLDSVAHVPGVTSVAAILGAPMGFDKVDVGYAVKGRQIFAPGVLNLPIADILPVTPNLFSTMRIPLLRGRNFTAQDTLNAPMVLLINQELARQIFPGQDPIGQQIMCGFDVPSFDLATWWTIVGVVGDIRNDSPAAAPSPTLYVPIAQHPDSATDVQIVVRTGISPHAMIQTLTSRMKQTHPEIAIKATTMRENIGETQRSEDFRTILFGSFAFVSILLAAVGMYGVTAYSVAQRRFEFGLRMALGANRQQLLRMVLNKALAMAALGIGIGVGLALGLTRVLESVTGKLPAFDLTSYAIAAATVLGIALLATLIPARSAANVDPMTVLRSE